MAIYADPRQGEAGRILADDDGRPLATFTARPTPERPWAEAFRPVPGADRSRLAAVAVADLPGVRLRTDPATADALQDAGASVVRHTHRLRRELQDDAPPLEWAAPPLPEGLRLSAVDRPIREVAEAAAVATGAPDRAASVTAALEGRSVGPLLDDPSSLAIDPSDRIVGAVLVLSRPLGPLVHDLFAAEEAGGADVGLALLRRAVAVASLSGEQHAAVLVAHGDPVRDLYERLGFVETAVDVTLDMPGVHPAWR